MCCYVIHTTTNSHVAVVRWGAPDFFLPPMHCACVFVSGTYTLCSARSLSDTGRESAHPSAHRVSYLKDKPRGGAETSVWQSLLSQAGCAASAWRPLSLVRRADQSAACEACRKHRLGHVQNVHRKAKAVQSCCTSDTHDDKLCDTSVRKQYGYKDRWRHWKGIDFFHIYKSLETTFKHVVMRGSTQRFLSRQAGKYTHVHARIRATPSCSLHPHIAVGSCVVLSSSPCQVNVLYKQCLFLSCVASVLLSISKRLCTYNRLYWLALFAPVLIW